MSTQPDDTAAPSGTGESAAAGAGAVRRDDAVIRVEREFGRLFARIRIGWREAAATVHPELPALGYQVLVSIISEEATTAGKIIERLQVDKSVVSRHVRQLTELGLVDSIRDPHDRRARKLVATDLAKERVAIARANYEGRIGERLRTWSADDLDHFADLLHALGG